MDDFERKSQVIKSISSLDHFGCGRLTGNDLIDFPISIPAYNVIVICIFSDIDDWLDKKINNRSS